MMKKYCSYSGYHDSPEMKKLKTKLWNSRDCKRHYAKIQGTYPVSETGNICAGGDAGTYEITYISVLRLEY